MQVRVLGPITVAQFGGVEPGLSTSLRQMLGLLVAAGERGMLQDSMAEELWGEGLPSSWESSFRNGVTRLRNKLGKDALISTSGRYHLNRAAVDVDAWDLLDQAAASRPTLDLGSFLSGVPFAGVEHSPTIRLMADRIQVARSDLLRLVVADGTAPLGGNSLALLRSHQRRNSIDDDLLELVIRAHLKAAEISRALAIMNEARIEADHDDRMISPRLIALEEMVRRQQSPGPLLAKIDIDPSPTRLPDELSKVLDVELVGRKPELNTLLEAVATRNKALIFGRSGTGKTRLLAAVADHLAIVGYEVRYASAQTNTDIAYGSILAAVPEAASMVRSILEEDEDQRRAEARCNAELLDAFASVTTGRVCLLVDDVHLLDSHSERFLLFAASQTAQPVPMILAARPDSTASGWSSFRQSLDARGFPFVHLNVLTRFEVFKLASSMHPDAGGRLLKHLTDDVISLTGGLPGVVRYVIARADPETLLLHIPDFHVAESSSPLHPYAGQFSVLTAQVGIAAAVLGHSFDLAEVGELLEMDLTEVRERSHSLVNGEFVQESVDLNRFSFVHALHREALLDCATPAQLRRLHRKAAGLLDNVKRRARHSAAAVPLVSEKVACSALVDASRVYFDEGAWREAASALREAQRLASGELALDDQCRFAAALDLSGADGSRIRANAFESAADAGDWSAALRVATSGLQASERVDGDPKRVVLLERIPAGDLADGEKFGLAAAFVRQLVFLDRMDEARKWAEVSSEIADTADERLMAFVHQALVGHEESCRPLVLPHDFADVQDPVTSLRGLQISVLSHLERESAVVSRQLVAKMSRHTAATKDPYRTWHNAVLEDTLAFVDGNIVAACESSQRTYLVGDKFGIGDAEGVCLAFQFFWRYATGELALLRPELQRYAEAGETLVHRLMAAMIAGSMGRSDDDARTRLNALAEEAVGSRSPLAVPTLVLGAAVMDEVLVSDIRNRAYSRLLARAGTSALVANGVIHAGPVDRALAAFAPDRVRRVEHLHAAVDIAERQATPLWNVLCRMDLAKAGVPGQREAAEELASGTDLDLVLSGPGFAD